MFRTALFTLVQNEADFLPHWFRHYCRDDAFQPSDIYVLDHDSRGDSAKAIAAIHSRHGFNRLSLSHTHAYDAVWMAGVARAFQEYLLHTYDVVVFAAADEFLIARGDDGRPMPLRGFLETTGGNFQRAVGCEVVHVRDAELPLPANPRRLLADRGHWYHPMKYAKTLVARRPVFWQPGFYTAANIPPSTPPNPRLLLVHLARVDYDWCLRRHREIVSREWVPGGRKEGPFRHNLVEEPGMLQRWLLCDADDTGKFAKLTAIPEWIRDTL